MSQQKIEPLIDSKEVVTQDEERRGQALKMVKMGSSVSIMSRISKLLSCWVFHTVRQAARPPPLDGVLEVSSPTSHSISMLREQRSLVLAFFFFLSQELLFIGKKKHPLESHTKLHSRCHLLGHEAPGLQGDADHLSPPDLTQRATRQTPSSRDSGWVTQPFPSTLCPVRATWTPNPALGALTPPLQLSLSPALIPGPLLTLATSFLLLPIPVPPYGPYLLLTEMSGVFLLCRLSPRQPPPEAFRGYT